MKFTTLDLEWKIINAEIICGCWYNEKQSDSALSISTLLNQMFHALQDKENIIFSHYGGGSDFLFLLKELVGKKDFYLNENEFYESNGKIISFVVNHKKKRYQFRDSYAILPSSLEKLALSFLLQGKKFDSGNLSHLNISQIVVHCMTDCKLLHEVITKFIEYLNLEGLPLTAASLALSDLQKRSDFKKLLTQSKEDYEKFLPWFRGGHTDVYKRYAAPCWHYDINSCYSTSQTNFGCPIGKFTQIRNFDEKKAGLFVCKVNSKKSNPYTWQTIKSGYDKLYFLNSDEYFLVTDIEIKKMIEERIEFKIISGYEWEIDQDFFKEFVEYWFNYRKLGQAQKEIGKIFLNAGGYGKFAIRRDRERVHFGDDCDYFFSPDFQIGVKSQWKDFWYSQIHIAARITAGARILLYEAQQRVGIENLCYSDTDSVYSTKPIKDFENESFLGGLKQEGIYKRVYFLGNKFYGKVNQDDSFGAVLKGFPDKNFNEENYIQGLQGNLTFKYASQRLLKFRSALRRASDFVAVKEFLREVKTLEIKRKLLSNGIDTQPYFLSKGKLK